MNEDNVIDIFLYDLQSKEISYKFLVEYKKKVNELLKQRKMHPYLKQKPVKAQQKVTQRRVKI